MSILNKKIRRHTSKLGKIYRDPMGRGGIHSMATWVLGCRTWGYLKSCRNALEFTNWILQYRVASSIKAWYFSWKTDISKWLMSRTLMGCWMVQHGIHAETAVGVRGEGAFCLSTYSLVKPAPEHRPPPLHNGGVKEGLSPPCNLIMRIKP